MSSTLSSEEFLLCEEDFNRAVLATPDISAICSASDWILAAAEALDTPDEVLFERSGDCWLAFGRTSLASGGTLIHPLELTWGFASPFAGPAESELFELFEGFMGRRRADELVLLSGIPVDSALDNAILKRFPNPQPWRAEPLVSMLAFIPDGIAAYLARRKKSFQKTLGVSRRRVEKAGITIVAAHERYSAEEILSRLLHVEADCWKAQSGSSIFQQPGYLDFYAALISRAHRSGRLRALFAEREGEEIAYIFGSIMGGHYRGFQMSFREEQRSLGLGHILQLRMMDLAYAEGVHTYDFGMWARYKESWADRRLALRSFVIAPESL